MSCGHCDENKTRYKLNHRNSLPIKASRSRVYIIFPPSFSIKCPSFIFTLSDLMSIYPSLSCVCMCCACASVCLSLLAFQLAGLAAQSPILSKKLIWWTLCGKETAVRVTVCCAQNLKHQDMPQTGIFIGDRFLWLAFDQRKLNTRKFVYNKQNQNDEKQSYEK